jgi:hypothetical protein|tara:strand:- start:214 stop:456 length:243 start_codon:yes stop_codon:yes gene_type:complete
MEGNRKTYGFKEISNLGSEIEKSVLDEKPDAIYQALEKLLDYLNRIQITYECFLNVSCREYLFFLLKIDKLLSSHPPKFF